MFLCRPFYAHFCALSRIFWITKCSLFPFTVLFSHFLRIALQLDICSGFHTKSRCFLLPQFISSQSPLLRGFPFFPFFAHGLTVGWIGLNGEDLRIYAPFDFQAVNGRVFLCNYTMHVFFKRYMSRWLQWSFTFYSCLSFFDFTSVHSWLNPSILKKASQCWDELVIWAVGGEQTKKSGEVWGEGDKRGFI